MAIPDAFAVEIRLLRCWNERWDEALAESQRKNISECVEIAFESARVPVDGTRIGRASVYVEYEQLGFEYEEIRLLSDFIGENGTLEVAMIPHQYGALRLYIGLHVLILVDRKLTFAHSVGFHQHLLLVFVLVYRFLSALVLLC